MRAPSIAVAFALVLSPLASTGGCGGSSEGQGGASVGTGVLATGSGLASGSSAHGGASTTSSNAASGGATSSAISTTGAAGASTTDAASTGSSASTSTGCVAMCSGKMCGPDGCGGVCGMCNASEACTSTGLCVGQPAGPATKRFDVATLDCGAAYAACQVNGINYDHCCPQTIANDPKNKCFCAPEFDHLNFAGSSHFVVVGSDIHRGDIWAAGNFQAVYVNDLNDLYPGSGKAKADAVIADAMANFPTGVPSWFLVNELSTMQWPNDPAYRTYVLDFANRMNGFYNKKIIVASPFATIAAHNADWTTLSGDAFIGVEVQLTGAEVNASGNSVSASQMVFQTSVDAYVAHGVKLTRLMLIDNFGGTKAGAGFGREGVSAAGWNNAIQRARPRRTASASRAT